MKKRIWLGFLIVLITSVCAYPVPTYSQSATPSAPGAQKPDARHWIFLPLVNQGGTNPGSNPTPEPTTTPGPDPTATPDPTSTPDPDPTPIPGTTDSDWSMLAGNPQRTSWTPEEVEGGDVDWYRVIEPYISQNVQVIAGSTDQFPNGLLFIATSAGLYTFRADNGALAWRFDTELPLGNSPTFSEGVVYVGGFDRKLYALNADTGVKIWEFSGANAGYDSNPLVVDGKVILGNRDGAVYAVGAVGSSQAGQQVWKYQTGGPVDFSAAYKNNVVFVVSNDGYAYGLRLSDGSRLWQSSTQMRGDGFHSYWPVLYTDPATGKDYLVVAASSGYRAFSSPGAGSLQCSGQWCEWEDEWNGNVAGTLGQSITLRDPWVANREVVSFNDTLMEYFSANPNSHPHYYKPWRRFYYIFNATNGQEYTLTSKNGFPTYAPIDPILSNSGNPYPPVVGGDGLLYMGNHYFSNGQSLVMGWRFGTPYMVIEGLQGAGDEPWALSAGGNQIYRTICCDRSGSTASTDGTNYFGNIFWNYDLSERAPGYDEMWWGADPNLLSRLTGNFGRMPNGSYSVNGIYHEHGDQSPLVPFRGRAYALKSNALIAFGPGGGSPNHLPNITSGSGTNPANKPINATTLKTWLESEVQKIVAAGHLRPGYYNAGQFNDAYPDLVNYFSSPGETLYTLSIAYPYLSSSLKTQVKAYLKAEFQTYFVNDLVGDIGWQDGAAREWVPAPPEVEEEMQTFSMWGTPDGYNAYGLWKYAQNVAPEDAQSAYQIANQIWDNAPNMEDPYRENRLVAGEVGKNGLSILTGHGGSTTVTSCSFTKDTPYQDINGPYTKRTLNISRNFIFMVPELAACLRTKGAVNAAISEYEWVGPYWFVARYAGSVGESTTQNLYDYPALFAAKAYIQQLSQAELVKYLDVPAFARGDLFYIQNLVAALQAP